MKLLLFNAILFVILLLLYFLVVLTNRYSGTPLIRSPMGQKRLAVLRVDRIDEVFFTEKCVVDLPD